MGAFFIGLFLLVIGVCALIDIHDSFEYMVSIAVIMLGMTFCSVGLKIEYESNLSKKESTINKIELYKDSINQIQYQKSLEQELYTLKDSLQQLKTK